MRKPYVKLQEAVKIAESLAKKQGGYLPNVQWLLDHEYGWLYRQIKRHPEEFAHIKRRKHIRGSYKATYWVEIAERLAKRNGGVLPSPTWLCDEKHGYRALCAYMKQNPDLFVHIRQNKRKRAG